MRRERYGTRVTLGLLCVLMLAATAGQAAPRRVALVVGNNRGDSGKPELRYAERDARRFAEVLQRLGGVPEVEVLVGHSAAKLRQVLARIEGRLAQAGDEAVFFFYYSGHADDSALQLGTTRMSFGELRRTLQRFPARTAVAFIDACQSGRLTRQKGGREVPVVDVRFDDQAYRGRVFITSSTAGENSQESDQLKASFFTHYLLSGLRGAADDSGDGRVSLEEAYRFAYRHTVARTADTLRGPQHPTYQIEMSGTGQMVLTWLSPRMSYLTLPRGARGRYYIYGYRGDRVVAEVDKRAGRRLRIALAPGRYEVRQPRGPRQAVQVVQVRSGETVVDEGAMVLRGPQRGATKGGVLSRHEIALGYELQAGYLDDAALQHGVRAAYGYRFGSGLSLGLALSYARSDYARSDQLAIDLHEVGAMVDLSWSWRRWRRVWPAAALELGGSWVRQRGQRPGAPAETRSQPVFRYRGRLGLALPVVGTTMLGLWGTLGQVVLDKQQGLAGPLVGGLRVELALWL